MSSHLGPVSENLGAGELLITSIDHEGLKKGMDIDLLDKLRENIAIPIIFSGGIGGIKDFLEVAPKVDAIAIASVLHYDMIGIKEIKKNLNNNNIVTR